MEQTSFSEFFIGTKILSGIGSVSKVGEEAFSLGGTNALIVTDKGVAEAGLTRPVTDSLGKRNIEFVVFDGVEPNPSIKTVEAGKKFLDSRDIIVSIGGGSSIDTGKALAIIATNGGTIKDYEGFEKVSVPPLPLIAIPTTVGTGSEVTRGTVITDKSRRLKTIIISNLIFPKVAILDATLLRTLPRHIVASTGLDALTQAIEGYLSKKATPITDALHIAAIKLIAGSLRQAYADSENLEAMNNMLLGSTIDGIGMANSGVGGVHAMANIVGGYFDVPHGVANSILLPHVMEYNLIANPNKYRDIAIAMGEKVDGLSLLEAAHKAIDAVKKLSADIDIPRGLGEVGVDEAEIPAMAKDAFECLDMLTNPRQPTLDDIISLYHKAF